MTERKYLDGAQPIDLDAAQASFHDFLNQERVGATLIYTGSLSSKMPAKYAVMAVMTTKTALSPRQIVDLLAGLDYERSLSTVRIVLARLVEFGFALKQKRHTRLAKTEYRMTKRGIQFLNSPKAQVIRIKQPPTQLPPDERQVTMSFAKVPLVKAVENTVFEYTSQRKSFSAHDITVRVREKLERGELEVEPVDTGTVFVTGKSVAKIDNDVVKDIVHNLYVQKMIVDYTRMHNGTYFEYIPGASS